MISKFVQRLGSAAKAGGQARKVFAKSISGVLAAMRHGGVLFTEDEMAFQLLLNDMNKTPKHSMAYYLDEVCQNEDLRRQFEHVAAERKLTKYRDWSHRVDYNRSVIGLTYGLIREVEPDLVVETGTASGSNTAMVLAALKRNGHGRLISIDIPPTAGKLTMDITIGASQIGYWIPENYKDIWEYQAGDAKILLPRLMAAQTVDFFIHDSLHTTTHMAFEYAVARALMPENSVILSDDILWNESFDSFAALNHLKAYAGFANLNFGGVINRFSAHEREQGVGIVRQVEAPSA